MRAEDEDLFAAQRFPAPAHAHILGPAEQVPEGRESNMPGVSGSDPAGPGAFA